MTCQSPRTAQGKPPIGSRVAAGLALLVFLATLALLVLVTVSDWPYVLASVAAGGLAISALWIAATNRRYRWWAAIAAVCFVGAAGTSVVAAGRSGLAIVAVVSGIAVSSLLGTLALRWEVRQAIAERWHDVPAARQGFVLMNPRSGDGTVARFHLVDEARRRGLQTMLLGPGDDLRKLAEQAVAQGADALGMAGGDGSQAVVAAVASASCLPFVCVPAGTRNHLALDLGINRSDPVKALDAFKAARETTIDLGEVNGEIFVNNVSLGIYARIVASQRYREAKRRTVVEMLPDLLGPEAESFGLALVGPAGTIENPQVVQVSNNPYSLSSVVGFGSRSRLNSGTLGVAALTVDRLADVHRLVALEGAGHPERYEGWHQWTASYLEVTGPSRLAAAVDGEARTWESPLHFAVRPLALRVRIASGEKGASPALLLAPVSASTLVGLARAALGHPSGVVADRTSAIQ